ncbi:hypothetical protein EAG_06787 [Camponotus floridanus]|uniref:Uncharacterized protein n=2 Tax=Aculeata TaxID=7434 RepID=E2A6G7_CAMFO|nr:hypothetical protein EAG_06787 [Camponotus floridanus]
MKSRSDQVNAETSRSRSGHWSQSLVYLDSSDLLGTTAKQKVPFKAIMQFNKCICCVCRYLEEMGLVEREAEMQELNAPRPGRSRDLFGVQLECRPVRGPTQKAHVGSDTAASHLKQRQPRKVRLLYSLPCHDDLIIAPFSALLGSMDRVQDASKVTSLLLEGERRKLAVLQRELQVALEEGGSVKVKEKQRQELLHAISKIQGQHEQLDKEYRIHAAGILLCNSRGSGKTVKNKDSENGKKCTPKKCKEQWKKSQRRHVEEMCAL